MDLLYDRDVNMDALKNRTVAVLGYGNQGRAQAMNLRDSGVNVIVGNREDDYRDQAIADGFQPMSIADAAVAGDILLVLTTDESQPHIWTEQIAPGIQPGNTVCWASGYNIGFEVIVPPKEVDVIMVAPRMTGNFVRSLFESGRGALAMYAVHQDATGTAHETALALCKGIGLTRGGVFKSTFREEAELDLFAEQVVWAGFTQWMVDCFEIGVKHGFSPELMVMELYCSGEGAEIMGMMANQGFFKQMARHSTTSQYGTLSRGPRLIPNEMRRRAEEFFTKDIRGGAFVDEWSSEQAEGSKTLKTLKEKGLQHPMNAAEDRVIALIRAARGE